MSDKQEKQDIDQLMAEADELINKINTDCINDMEEQLRMEFEQHAKKLETLKAGLQDGAVAEKETSNSITSSSEGMHEAFEDIVKAMKELKSKIYQ
ncbi:MAG: hypothetical protein R6U68_17640 [Desulfobacteraceae bacterium]